MTCFYKFVASSPGPPSFWIWPGHEEGIVRSYFLVEVLTLSCREYHWSVVSVRSREERGRRTSPKNWFLPNLSQSHTLSQRVRELSSTLESLYYTTKINKYSDNKQDNFSTLSYLQSLIIDRIECLLLDAGLLFGVLSFVGKKVGLDVGIRVAIAVSSC